MVRTSFEEVKARCGPVLHREELAHPTWFRSVDSSHLPVQGRLEVSALSPQQGRNVSEERDELHITYHSCNHHPEDVSEKIITHQRGSHTTPTIGGGRQTYRLQTVI